MANRTALSRVELLKIFGLEIDRTEGYPKDRYEAGPMKDANGIDSGSILSIELTVDGHIVFTRTRSRPGPKNKPVEEVKTVGTVPVSACLGWWNA